MVTISLIMLLIGYVSHIDEVKKDLVRDVHRLSRLGERLKDSPNGGFMVCHNSESSLVVELKSIQHLHRSLTELKESVLNKQNESFSLRGDDILMYQGSLCIPNIDRLRNYILDEVHGSRYFNYMGFTKIYHDLREIFWWEC